MVCFFPCFFAKNKILFNEVKMHGLLNDPKQDFKVWAAFFTFRSFVKNAMLSCYDLPTIDAMICRLRFSCSNVAYLDEWRTHAGTGDAMFQRGLRCMLLRSV